MDFLLKLKNSLLSLNKKNKFLLPIILFILLIVLFVIWYNISLLPISKNAEIVTANISLGSGANRIADVLKENDLIKSKSAFKLYLLFNKVSGLQAGSYRIAKNMTVEEITKLLKTGKVANPNEFKVTFIEGKNISWFAEKISTVTSNSKDDVFNFLKDEENINSLIESYWFLTDEIKNENIYYPLEGYLFPDTYTFKSKEIRVSEIFKMMLDQTDKVLTQYKEEISTSRYSVHELITMGSIIELEGIHEYDKKNIASVFYNRLTSNMSLGSDVTTYYAFRVEMGERDLHQSELNTYNPYNTRGPNMSGKLPVGPISSISRSSIEAALRPSDTDYLFFVADKNGKVYFTKTGSEHTILVNDLKANGLWLEFK